MDLPKSKLRLEEFQELRFVASVPPRKKENGMAVCWILPKEEAVIEPAGTVMPRYNGWHYSCLRPACPHFYGDEKRIIHCGGVAQVVFGNVAEKMRHARKYCECAGEWRRCTLARTLEGD